MAGNFVGGKTSPPNPLWGLAVAFQRSDGSGDVVLYRVDQNIDPKTADGPLTRGGAVTVWMSGRCGLQQAGQVLAAFDLDGDSILLGPPVHFQLHDQIRTNYVLQEPPKHTVWLNDQVVDVSRKFDFYIDLENEQGVTLNTKSTDASDWNIGGSREISAKATATANIGIVKVEASLEVEHAVGTDYDEHQEDYDSSYGERTLTFTGQTNADDFVATDLQLIDLWRYRVYGTTASGPGGEALNAFYDLILPGPMVELRGSGLTLDWYQPAHENGNILSYPPLANNTFDPPDLGPFTLPDGTERWEPLVPATLLDTGGASGTIALKFSETSGGGSERSTSNKLTASTGVTVGVSVGAEFPAFAGEASAAVARNAHESNSTAESKTSDWTSSRSTSITLSKPAGDTAHAYRFAPVFYVTKDGTLKVTHAVDPLGVSAATFWPAPYGKKPDPALNLPLRFNATYPDSSSIAWVVNATSSAKKLRGFFLLSATLNPVTHDYDYLAYAPVDGGEVRVEARVYNHSTGQPFTALDVLFQAVEYDARSDTETGPAGIWAGSACRRSTRWA